LGFGASRRNPKNRSRKKGSKKKKLIDWGEWHIHPNIANCEECRSLYEDNPPCEEECNKPEEIEVESRKVWSVWQLLNEFDRQKGSMGYFGKIPTSSILSLCQVYNLSLEDFELICQLERRFYPILAQAHSESIKSTRNSGGEDGIKNQSRHQTSRNRN
jgi:hypothetical protein